MEKYVIRGGKPLVGDVNIGGAKNAAVAILPATILAGGKCLIENLPCISDVMASLQILSELGASIRMVSRSTYEIDTSHLDSTWAALVPVRSPCRAAAIWARARLTNT